MTSIASQTRTRSPEFPTHRVLYLIDRLHSTEGGAEGVVHKLCRFLPAHGFGCSVVTLGVGNGVEKQFPCPVRVLSMSTPYYWAALRNARLFAQLLRSEQVEILHTFFPVSDIWGGIVARFSGCPVLISSRRDMGILRSRKHHIQYRLANALFTQIQAVSESVREYCIREDRLSPDKVVTVPNGVDLEAIDSCQAADRRAVFGVDTDTPVIIVVANLRPVKGIEILIRSMPLVIRQIPRVSLIVVGEAHEPGYLQNLQDLAMQIGASHSIQFLGRRTNVYALMKASDVFCLPSRSEGMSNALLEAMACRLPCVATDVGGNPEVVIQGRSGFLVPPEDPETLAERIVAVLRNRSRAMCMGQAGRGVIETRFTIQRMVERLSLLYETLLEKRGLHCSINVEQDLGTLGCRRQEKTVRTAAS